MTLNLTVVKPHGIWQCCDFRLTNSVTKQIADDWSPKEIELTCQDETGSYEQASIIYTGLGAIGGKPISECVAEWAVDPAKDPLQRMKTTLDEAIERLRSEATAAFARNGINSCRHVFSIAISRKTGLTCLQVANCAGQPPVLLPSFQLLNSPRSHPAFRVAEKELTIMYTGPAVAQSAWDMLQRETRRSDIPPEHLSEALAGFNRQASKASPEGRFISEACLVIHTPPWNPTLAGRRTTIFGWGQHIPHTVIAQRSFMFGMNFVDVSKAAMKKICQDLGRKS